MSKFLWNWFFGGLTFAGLLAFIWAWVYATAVAGEWLAGMGGEWLRALGFVVSIGLFFGVFFAIDEKKTPGGAA